MKIVDHLRSNYAPVMLKTKHNRYKKIKETHCVSTSILLILLISWVVIKHLKDVAVKVLIWFESRRIGKAVDQFPEHDYLVFKLFGVHKEC